MSLIQYGSVAVAFLLLLCASGKGDEVIKHLKAGEEIVGGIQPEHNEYSYSEISLQWKGENGATEYAAHCDCSGFVTLLLEHVYGYTPTQMLKWTGHRRPVAKVLHDVIEAEHGFKQIKLLNDMRPGDLIAIKYLDDSKDTGHVMIVAEVPRPHETTAPRVPQTKQWEVDVIDSSKSGHGKDDTRHKADKTFNTGVGRGTLRLYTTANGEIAGYSWSTSSKSTFESPDKHHLVVGRLNEGYQP